MTERFDIAGYCRISVDEELDRDNTSIENQKSIITDFVKEKFPESSLTFYEDRDRSGYTFEQREGYQSMRPLLMGHTYDILVVKDFSRFSRRNSRGLVELEDLRDAGVRIISIGDSIDYPTYDDWTAIQFRFLVNEMPVTDASKKVKRVVQIRQSKGEWICAAPYGYIVNKSQRFEVVPTEADVIRRIYQLYMDGWGYKRIANWLTDEGIPTPRMSERDRKEAAGETSKREVKSTWAIATVQGILENDFYIGTFRQGKYTRKKINGSDMKKDAVEHIVFENHHQAILDYRTFATVWAMRTQRSRNHYRGVKINDNVYSGYLQCGDCGSPMFAMSRRDLKDAYRCGLYHRRGLKACTSHHIRVEKLDELLKAYVRKVMQNSEKMLDRLNDDIQKQDEDLNQVENAAGNLAEKIADLQEELKVTKRQRIRDLMKHPEQEKVLEETYDELEADLARRIEGLQHQLQMTDDKRNTIIRVNRVAKLAMEVFQEILEKEKLDRHDLDLLIEKTLVYEDHIEVHLKPDIDALLTAGTLESAANFDLGIETAESINIVQSTLKGKPDKVFHANVIRNGDPLEIYTERNGEVIFKKYSPMGELSEFAEQICESLGRNTGRIAAVADRDSIIALSGAPKRELVDKQTSRELSEIMEQRRPYRYSGGNRLRAAESVDGYYLGVAAPILSEGDLMGCVMVLMDDKSAPVGETEQKVCQTVAGFLGKQMES